jgi:hypothetical protein
MLAGCEQKHARGYQPSGEWKDPDLGASVVVGAATPERLWLLGESGKLVEIDRGSGERRVIATQVQNIMLDGPRLWAMINDKDGVQVTDLMAASPTRERVDAGPYLTVLLLVDGRPAIRSPDGLLVRGDAGWKLTRLPWRAMPGAPSSAATAGGGLYTGINRGEWGGELQRVALSNEGEPIPPDTGEGTLCDYNAPNPACSPITGVITDPAKRGCVVFTSGQWHMGMYQGEIGRACGSRVEKLFSERQPPPRGYRYDDMTRPFDGLTPVGDGWIAVSGSKLFRGDAGAVRPMPSAQLRQQAGIVLDDRDPGYVLVMSHCCIPAEAGESQRYGLIVVPVVK